MTTSWITVENSDMFSFTGIRTGGMAQKMRAFLDQYVTGFDYVFNPEEIYSLRHWHMYYHTPVNEAAPKDDPHFMHTAGVVEFRQIHTEHIGWRDDAFQWRMIGEAFDPPMQYDGLPLRVLQSLTVPAWNHTAERWRYQSWKRLGLQPPPHVGMGVTYCIGGDRYPYVVVEANPKRRAIAVKSVKHRLIRGSVLSPDQGYEFGEAEGNQSWEIHPSRRKADAGQNLWRFQGGVGYYIVGYMSAYRDPHY